MKLVWSPDTALKAYLDTVKSSAKLGTNEPARKKKYDSIYSRPVETYPNENNLLADSRAHLKRLYGPLCELYKESSVAEFISAMAAGWNAQLIVETWSQGGVVETSVGLAIASHHTGGRHVCVVPDEESRSKYIEAMENAGISPREVIVGLPEEAMEGLTGIDFLVVDCRRNDFARIFRVANLGHRGAVLICKNASSRAVSDFRWRSVLDGKSRIVRSVLLPVGKGLDIAHVGASSGSSGPGRGESRWIKRFDHQSGEEYVIRK